MRRYVQLATSFWIDTHDWPRNARYLFLYLWSNDHVDGITGIGHVPDPLIRVETGLMPKALEQAWVFLVERKKVFQENGWYWIIDRAKHTCLREDGKPHARMAPAARSRIGDPSVPDAIRDAFTNTYRILFDNLSNTSPRGHARAVSRKPLAVEDSETVEDPPTPLAKIPEQAAKAYQQIFGAIGDAQRFATVTRAWKPGTMAATLKELGAKKVKEIGGIGEQRRLSYLRKVGDRVDKEPPPESTEDRIGRAVEEGSRG